MKTIKGIWRFSRVICYTFVCLFQAYTRFKRVDRKEKGQDASLLSDSGAEACRGSLQL